MQAPLTASMLRLGMQVANLHLYPTFDESAGHGNVGDVGMEGAWGCVAAVGQQAAREVRFTCRWRVVRRS